MSFVAAIVDIGSPQEFLAALPEGTDVTQVGPDFWDVSYNGQTLFAKRVFASQSRWVAVALSSGPVFAWLQSRLDNVKVKRITKELYLANQAAFNAIGFNPVVRDGAAFIRLPHVISGQSPWIEVQQ